MTGTFREAETEREQTWMYHPMFITKERFIPALKEKERLCLLKWDFKMVPQDRSLIAEGSASHSTFGGSGDTSNSPGSIKFWFSDS